MLLTELKAAIDAGRTAKHQIWRSILHVLIRKELGFYAVQTEGYINEDGVIIVPVVTVFYPTWEMLLDSFRGCYVDAQWWTCDDKLADYLPPEREDRHLF
jgi:hypothetical protein